MPFPPDIEPILVIPEGATSGRRIEIDSTTGEIRLYDDADNLRLQLGGPATQADNITFYTGDPDEDSEGLIAAHVLGAGGTRNAALTIAGPALDVTPCEMTLFSRSADGTEGRAIHFTTDDMLVNGLSLPLGVVGRFPPSTGNDSARAAGVNTDMTCTPGELLAGRLYRASINTQGTIGTVGAAYALDVELDDGTPALVGRLWRLPTASPGALHHVVGSCEFTVASDVSLPDLTVQNAAGSGGTFTAQGAADRPRTFTVEDIGAAI